MCRLKENAKIVERELISETELTDKAAGVLKEEKIVLTYKKEKETCALLLRLVHYRDEKEWLYKFNRCGAGSHSFN